MQNGEIKTNEMKDKQKVHTAPRVISTTWTFEKIDMNHTGNETIYKTHSH